MADATRYEMMLNDCARNLNENCLIRRQVNHSLSQSALHMPSKTAPFIAHQPSLSSRASSSILIKPFKRPNYVLSYFPFRSIDCWNLFSLILKQSKSQNMFKHNLNSVDLTHF